MAAYAFCLWTVSSHSCQMHSWENTSPAAAASHLVPPSQTTCNFLNGKSLNAGVILSAPDLELCCSCKQCFPFQEEFTKTGSLSQVVPAQFPLCKHSISQPAGLSPSPASSRVARCPARLRLPGCWGCATPAEPQRALAAEPCWEWSPLGRSRAAGTPHPTCSSFCWKAAHILQYNVERSMETKPTRTSGRY